MTNTSVLKNLSTSKDDKSDISVDEILKAADDFKKEYYNSEPDSTATPEIEEKPKAGGPETNTPDKDVELDKILEDYVSSYYEFYSQGRTNQWLDKRKLEALQAIKELFLTSEQEAYKKAYIAGALEGFNKAFDSHDYDGLRKYKANLQAKLKGDE